MTEERPAPLTPADCNLRGLPWMPMETVRLLDSDLFLLSTGDEFKAAVALWCKSWSQIPGGSLPNDERLLEALSGAKAWKKVRAMAMRGWILCSDGRLYHPVVAELAVQAWKDRTSKSLAPSSLRLLGVQAKHAEYVCEMGASRRVTPEEVHIHSLQSRIGGLSATIYSHTRQLTGEMPIGRATLVMAEADGRNHLQDLECKRRTAIGERLRIADELALLGKKPQRYAEYLAAVKALDAGGSADGQ